MRLPILVTALLTLAAGAPTTIHAGDGAADAMADISGERIRAHIEVLAADDMEGREAGTPGFDRAAAYVIKRFKAARLLPFGDENTYLQSIDFLESRLVEGTEHLVVDSAGTDHPLAYRDDFLCWGGYGATRDSVTAPLVFVGHGIVAPELEHDDYARVDVAGKIVVVLSGAPPRFPTDPRAYYSSSYVKRTIAVARGAVGMIFIRTPADEARYSWERYLHSAGTTGMRWLDANGNPFDAFPTLVAEATLSPAGAEKLFALAGRDLDRTFATHADGAIESFDLGLGATFARTSEQRRARSANVVAVLPGSDAALRNEFVIFTAHLDHIGIRGDEEDRIHNGAYDNAAGVAVVLEVAAAMARATPRPRRSVIFAAVTAEEKGLRGSSYLAVHNTRDIVANINIDMPYLAFPVADIEAFGAEHSTLHGAVAEATARAGMALTPDPMPERVRFIRSDQFSFVKRGIPALNLKAGSASSDSTIDGHAMLLDFLSNYYHLPGDDLSLPYNAEGAQRFARTALTLGLIVANADERPRWNDGDFFGDTFAR